MCKDNHFRATMQHKQKKTQENILKRLYVVFFRLLICQFDLVYYFCVTKSSAVMISKTQQVTGGANGGDYS